MAQREDNRIFLLWREGSGESCLHHATAYVSEACAAPILAELNQPNATFKYFLVPATLTGDITKLEKI